MTDGDFLPGDKRPSGPVPPEPPHQPWRDDMHTHYRCHPSELPSHLLTAMKMATMDSGHNKLNALLDGYDHEKHKHEPVLDDAPVGRENGSNWVKCADGIERPSHYANYLIDPVTFAMINDLPAWKFQVVKYTCRAGLKGDEEDDIRKAMRHLEMRLELLKRQKEDTLGHVVGRPL